jgi:hypothetical protein
MQSQNLWLGAVDLFLDCHLFETIHEFGDHDLVGASSCACFARRAHPDRFAAQDPLALTQEHHPDEFIREQIHCKRHRTAIGALATLITCLGLKRPESFHLFYKLIIRVYCFFNHIKYPPDAAVPINRDGECVINAVSSPC